MNPQVEFETLLKRHRFKLVSENKHYKFGDPDGRLIVCAKTPSDWRAWRNQVSVLKRIVSEPPPSSGVIEEERQRKELEKFIALNPTKKVGVGAGGAGKGKKSRGNGFYYDPPKATSFVPDEVKEKARNDGRWDALMHHVKKQRRQVVDELAGCYITAEGIIMFTLAREYTSSAVRTARKKVKGIEIPNERISLETARNGLLNYRKGGRENGMVNIIKKIAERAKLKDPGEAMLNFVTTVPETQYANIEFGVGVDEKGKEGGEWLVGRALRFATCIWQAGDYHRPSWLVTAEEEPSLLLQDPALRRGVKMFLMEMSPKSPAAERENDAIRKLYETSKEPKEKSMTEREAYLQAVTEICQETGRTRGDESRKGEKFLAQLDKDINTRADLILARKAKKS